MTLLQQLAGTDAPVVRELIATFCPIPADTVQGRWNNNPSWDNWRKAPAPFDNRPGWDNWRKR